MTDTIATQLEQLDGLVAVESWPTGTDNSGPEEYGIQFHEECISKAEILDELTELLTGDSPHAFFLQIGIDYADVYDLICTVHRHPWVSELNRLLNNISTATAWGFDWEPDNIWERYNDSPTLDLTDPGPLEIWIEAENDDYDSVLDSLEHTLQTGSNQGEISYSYPDYTLEVHNADSDHCHFSLTFN